MKTEDEDATTTKCCEEEIDCYNFPFEDIEFHASCLNLAASTPATVNALLNHLQQQSHKILPNIKNPKFLDLGCGDGRLVFKAAEAGFYAVGIDLDPSNIEKCKASAQINGLSDSCDFIVADIFTFNLSDFNLISCYLYKKTLHLASQVLWERLQDGDCILATILYKPKKWIPMFTDDVFKIYLFDEHTKLVLN